MMALRERLSQVQGQSASTAKLIDTAKALPQPLEIIAKEAEFAPIVAQLFATVSKCIDGVDQFTFDQLAELLRDMREELDDLPDLLPHLSEIHAAAARVALRCATSAAAAGDRGTGG